MASKKIKRLEEELKLVRVKDVVRYIKKYGVYDKQTGAYTHVVNERFGAVLRTDRPMSDVSTIVYQPSKVLGEEFLDLCVKINHKYDGSITNLTYLLEQVHKYFSCLDYHLQNPVEVCITFSSNIYLSGKDLKDIKKKFENMSIFTKTAKNYACVMNNIECVDNMNGYDDFNEEWNSMCWEEESNTNMFVNKG